MEFTGKQLLPSEEMKALLQENPKFKQLLEKLQDTMDADGTPYDLTKDLDKVVTADSRVPTLVGQLVVLLWSCVSLNSDL